MPDYTDSQAVEQFFDTVEKRINAPLNVNCVFSVTFCNKKENKILRAVLSGKELLKQCFLVSLGIKNHLILDVQLEIDVLSAGYNPDTDELIKFFEHGVKAITYPKSESIKEYTEMFKPYM